ncbi:MAG: acyl-CoA dehydratase activase [Promethearchaeota archaeon]
MHCKSDITHKLNRGEEKLEDILYSVLYGMVNKVMGLIWQSRVEVKRVLLIGGLSLNDAFVHILRKHLQDVEVVIKNESAVYEAYGTALLVRENPEHLLPKLNITKTFTTLPNLEQFDHLVRIIQPDSLPIHELKKESYILGVDVGSTTTKAVLVDPDTHTVLASHYGRTNGNPVKATQESIKKILDSVGDVKLQLVGVTGSGRSIVGAYLGTPAVYNEISAHSLGAAYFDPEVETIFEIGGQDSKYMFLENGVPVDYAMNASCSAGTGSFLEESAKCDLGVSVYEIAQEAMKAEDPVSFKADCAAFINTDIRTAMQEGYGINNIIGGLVYSIANNYLNKVKGSRRIGKKIFFQGGVAKNSAVGYAFAQITGMKIIIPPNPELIGAFGIALIAQEKHQLNEIDIMAKGTSLSSLIQEPMNHVRSFTCHACTNLCVIEQYEVGGRKFPFGGRCSKYEHIWKGSSKVNEKEDLVAFRTDLMFAEPEINIKIGSRGKIGIPRALLTHSLYPLFSTYFSELGFDVVLSEIDEEMEKTTHAPFCYPMQILHGAVLNLVKQNIPYIFLPHIHTMQKEDGWEDSTFCPITQASPYIISQAFNNANILKPYLDFKDGYAANTELVKFTADEFLIPLKQCERAYELACNVQIRVENDFHAKGTEILAKLQENGETGILLVGRSYNAYPAETCQAIPKKLVSMGVNVIPFDFLTSKDNSDTQKFTWYFGNLVKKAVNLAKSYPNLFILYINSFSCTIDAFIQNYVRTKLKSKPYLFLELDAHQADAGVQTRLEAFLEIIKNYQKTHIQETPKDFQIAHVEIVHDEPHVVTSSGEILKLNDQRVNIYTPPFSKYHTILMEKTGSTLGFNMNSDSTGEILPEYPIEGLKHSSGKECNPLAVVLGHIKHLADTRKPGEIIGYFIFRGGSPCVVYNYYDYLESFIIGNEIEDLFIFTFDKYNKYMGLSVQEIIRTIPRFIIIGDMMHEVESALQVVGNKEALLLLETYWNEFLEKMDTVRKTRRGIRKLVRQIKTIPRTDSPRSHPKVLISGDFFVRFSPFFLKELSQLYNKHGVIIKSTDYYEVLLYGLYFGNFADSPNLTSKILASKVALRFMERIERSVRNKFEKTGLLYAHPTDIEHIFDNAKSLISPKIYGEAIPAIGKGIETIQANTFDSLILIGPQFCLPYRISQAILKPIYLENQTPFLVYDAEVTGSAMSPNMKRLVLANIQQIKRRRNK